MIIETAGGPVEGTSVAVRGRTVHRFGGVPYAAAPTRSRRFLPPAPASRWADVRDCTERGPGPPQAFRSDGSVPDMFPTQTAEDCLTAEIYTADLDARAPVLVWIPGGRYQIGAAGLATYDGSLLAAEQEIVVVGLNYRLGALGFSPVEGYYNNGLRDLLFALRWVRDTIADFGGNGRRITLMGESAGAGCVAHLLASPLLDVDLDAAIIQSASPASTMRTSVADSVLDAVVDAAACENVATLENLAIEELIEAQESAAVKLMGSVGMMPFHPVIDNDVLTANPLAVARGGQLAVDALVIGTTANEMELFRSFVPELPDDVALRFIGRKVAPLLADADPVATARQIIDEADGDLVEAVATAELHLPARLLADGVVGAGGSAWRYVFAWHAAELGAFHALDLPFTFGTLDVADWRDVAAAHDTAADALSDSMRAAWGSVVRTGVPEGWERHDPRSPVVTTLAGAAQTPIDP